MISIKDSILIIFKYYLGVTEESREIFEYFFQERYPKYPYDYTNPRLDHILLKRCILGSIHPIFTIGQLALKHQFIWDGLVEYISYLRFENSKSSWEMINIFYPEFYEIAKTQRSARPSQKGADPFHNLWRDYCLGFAAELLKRQEKSWSNTYSSIVGIFKEAIKNPESRQLVGVLSKDTVKKSHERFRILRPESNNSLEYILINKFHEKFTTKDDIAQIKLVSKLFLSTCGRLVTAVIS